MSVGIARHADSVSVCLSETHAATLFIAVRGLQMYGMNCVFKC
jgi:hypothetical protein